MALERAGKHSEGEEKIKKKKRRCFTLESSISSKSFGALRDVKLLLHRHILRNPRTHSLCTGMEE